jgi:hypothetical protein
MSKSLHEAVTRVLESDAKLLARAQALSAADAPTQDGAALLNDTEKFIRQFVVLPEGALLPVALWAVATHLFSIFDCFPYLAIISPARRCGKTRLLEILALLCARPERTSNISEAAIFRLIESQRPTLLLDEMEQLREKSERAQIFRNLLNAGNRRDAVAIRCAEGGERIERFSVFSPKALAAIGSLPDTISDRAILVRMQRKNRDEKIKRFLFQRAEPEAQKIREAISAWARNNSGTVAEAYANAPDLDFLQDRDSEAWAPLFSVLAVASPARIPELRACAEILCGEKEDGAEESLAVRAILDAASVLRDDEERIASAELVSRMRAMEESPWSGPDFDARRLARFLRAFGIRSKVFRAGDATPRGYEAGKIREGAYPYKGVSSATSATCMTNKELKINDVALVADNRPSSEEICDAERGGTESD